MMMWWVVWWFTLVAAAATAAPAGEPLSPYDLLQIDTPLTDDDPEGPYPLVQMRSGYNSEATAPWIYLLDKMPRESPQVRVGVHSRQPLEMGNKGYFNRINTLNVPVDNNSDDMERPRRRFTFNPAVESLQKSVYNSYVDRQAHHNRQFLNCIGKRDLMSNPDCIKKH